MRARAVIAATASAATFALVACSLTTDTGGYSQGADDAAVDEAAPPAPTEAGPAAPRPPSAITLAPPVVHLVRGANATVVVSVAAPSEVELTLTASSLPEGVTSTPVKLAVGATSVALVLSATSTAREGVDALQVGAGGTLTASTTLSVEGAPGTLDETFATGGVLDLGNTIDVADPLFLPDGRFYVCAWRRDGSGAVVTRYEPSGVIDAGFGASGTVNVPFVVEHVTACTLTPNEQVVLVGTRPRLVDGGIQLEIHLLRLGLDGNLDETIGSHGETVVIVPVGANGNNVLVSTAKTQADGSVLLAGARVTNAGRDPLMVKVKPDGTADDAFGSGGSSILTSVDAATSLDTFTVAADGTIVAAGYASSATKSLVIEYGADGMPVAGFGSGGFATFNAGSFSMLHGVALVGAKVVVAGPPDISVSRLTAGGSLDLAFASGGVAQVDAFPGASYISADGLAFQPDGKMLVAARHLPVGATYANFVADVLRLTPDGALDPTFGAGGVAGGLGSAAGVVGIANHRLLIGPDGRILVAVFGEGSHEAYLLRLWP